MSPKFCWLRFEIIGKTELRHGHAINGEEVGHRSAFAHAPGVLVLLGVEKLMGGCEGGKLQDHDAVGFLRPFKRDGLAATGDETTAVLGDDAGSQLHVL
jgi:hypothetical protein